MTCGARKPHDPVAEVARRYDSLWELTRFVLSPSHPYQRVITAVTSTGVRDHSRIIQSLLAEIDTFTQIRLQVARTELEE